MISSLTASVNGLVTLASTAINERDTQKLAATRAELTQKVIEVQSKVLSQVGMISDMLTEREELKERIRELEQQLRYRESYRLVSVGTGFCYEFKQVADVTLQAQRGQRLYSLQILWAGGHVVIRHHLQLQHGQQLANGCHLLNFHS